MLQRRVLPLLLVPLLPAPAPVAGEPPVTLVCRGHEPEWNLRIEFSAATLATFGTQGPEQTVFEGRLQEAGWARPPFFVYRGRAEGAGPDLVAVITREACADTMADAAEGGGTADYTARLSLPDGAARLGCCATPPAAAPPLAASPPPVAVPQPVAPFTVRGEITVLDLPDGRACRHAGKGAPVTFQGQRLNFDCGRSGGDTVGLFGPLAADAGGLLTARMAVVAWRDGGSAPRPSETTAVRVSEIVLADGLTCRFAGKGVTLAFEGRRASYTCGTKDDDTVALLGDLEPAEAGFRIVRARVAHGESGFTLRSSETILITAPR